MNAKYEIYAVLGNHDYVLRHRNLQKLIDTLETYNCNVLQNENEFLHVDGTWINIIGIDDYSTNRSNLSSSYDGIKPGTNLVLTHDPNIVLNMKH